MQSALTKYILVSKESVERELRHKSWNANYGKDVPSSRLHLFQDVSESVSLEPEKRYEKNKILAVRLIENAVSRQWRDPVNGFAEIKNLCFCRSRAECITCGST